MHPSFQEIFSFPVCFCLQQTIHAANLWEDPWHPFLDLILRVPGQGEQPCPLLIHPKVLCWYLEASHVFFIIIIAMFLLYYFFAPLQLALMDGCFQTAHEEVVLVLANSSLGRFRHQQSWTISAGKCPFLPYLPSHSSVTNESYCFREMSFEFSLQRKCYFLSRELGSSALSPPAFHGLKKGEEHMAILYFIHIL